eukprot:TRINITY_DN1703_c0_g1_i19.p1 TRINITY_DN1703_c0_g1~~TRINITY_DN1703_c0_g1_i19.p1  ORF type:complete len:605 (-),score=133.32 TRINITY_DN1703_c0_g1_i19:62-1876(-)
MAIGNYDHKGAFCIKNKIIIGYIPLVEKNQLIVTHAGVDFVFESMLDIIHRGFLWKFYDGNTYHLFPRYHVGIGDLMGNAEVHGNTNRSCNHCIRGVVHMEDPEEFLLRTFQQTEEAYSKIDRQTTQNSKMKLSREWVVPFLSRHPITKFKMLPFCKADDRCSHGCCTVDILHNSQLGMMKYLVNLFNVLFNRFTQPNVHKKKLGSELADQPPIFIGLDSHSKLKKLPNDITLLYRKEGKHYEAYCFMIVFFVDYLGTEDVEEFDYLRKFFGNIRLMHCLLKLYQYDEDILEMLPVIVDRTLEQFDDVETDYNLTHGNRTKPHVLSHAVMSIMDNGPLIATDTGTFEGFHSVAKKQLKITNNHKLSKKGMTVQMIESRSYLHTATRLLHKDNNITGRETKSLSVRFYDADDHFDCSSDLCDAFIKRITVWAKYPPEFFCDLLEMINQVGIPRTTNFARFTTHVTVFGLSQSGYDVHFGDWMEFSPNSKIFGDELPRIGDSPPLVVGQVLGFLDIFGSVFVILRYLTNTTDIGHAADNDTMSPLLFLSNTVDIQHIDKAVKSVWVVPHHDREFHFYVGSEIFLKTNRNDFIRLAKYQTPAKRIVL